MTIGASTSRASGSTYFLALSFTYVTATSAPNARNALAHPQAIEFSLAMPTTRPFLPSRSLAFTTGSIAVSFYCSATRSLEHFRRSGRLCLGLTLPKSPFATQGRVSPLLLWHPFNPSCLCLAYPDTSLLYCIKGSDFVRK